MPYDPHVQDRSGELLGEGILQAGQALGAGLAEAIQKREEAKKQDAYSKAMLDYYHDKGQIDPEEYAKALKGSASTRAAVITGVQATLHDNAVRQQAQAKMQQAMLHDQLLNRQIAARAQENQAGLDERRYEFEHKEDGSQPRQVNIPGVGPMTYVPKTGQVIKPPAESGAGPGTGPMVSKDGKFYYDGKDWKPMKEGAAKEDAAADDPVAQRLAELEGQRKQIQIDAAKAGGLDKSPHLWSRSYKQQLDDLDAQRAELAKMTGGGTGSPPAEGAETPGDGPATGGTPAAPGEAAAAAPAPAPVQASAPGSAQAPPGQGAAPDAHLESARQAIARGADPDKVKALLKQLGGDPSKL